MKSSRFNGLRIKQLWTYRIEDSVAHLVAYDIGALAREISCTTYLLMKEVKTGRFSEFTTSVKGVQVFSIIQNDWQNLTHLPGCPLRNNQTPKIGRSPQRNCGGIEAKIRSANLINRRRGSRTADFEWKRLRREVRHRNRDWLQSGLYAWIPRIVPPSRNHRLNLRRRALRGLNTSSGHLSSLDDLLPSSLHMIPSYLFFSSGARCTSIV